jgi:hypothetical protein
MIILRLMGIILGQFNTAVMIFKPSRAYLGGFSRVKTGVKTA